MYLARQAAKAVQEAPLPTTMLEWALAYARLGYCVFPLHNIKPNGICTCRKGRYCEKPGKHTRIGAWNDPWGEECKYYSATALARKYYQQASDHPLTISAWWNRWPEANIGIALQYDQIGIDYDDWNAAYWIARYLGYESTRLPRRPKLDYMMAGTYACESPAAFHQIFTSPLMFNSYTNRSKMFNARGKPVRLDLKCWGGFLVAPPSIVLKNMAKKGEPPRLELKSYKIINLLKPAPLPLALEELFISSGLTIKHNPLINGWITDVTPYGFPSPSQPPTVIAEGCWESDEPDDEADLLDLSNTDYPIPPDITQQHTATSPVPTTSVEAVSALLADSNTDYPIPPDITATQQRTETASTPEVNSETAETTSESETATNVILPIDLDYEYRVWQKVYQMLAYAPIYNYGERDTAQQKMVGYLVSCCRSEGKDFIRRVGRYWFDIQSDKSRATVVQAYEHLDRTIEGLWERQVTNLSPEDYIVAWMAQALPATVITKINAMKLGNHAQLVLGAMLKINEWKKVNAPLEMPFRCFTWAQISKMILDAQGQPLSKIELYKHRKKFVSWGRLDPCEEFVWGRKANTASILKVFREDSYGQMVKGELEPGRFIIDTGAASIGVT